MLAQGSGSGLLWLGRQVMDSCGGGVLVLGIVGQGLLASDANVTLHLYRREDYPDLYSCTFPVLKEQAQTLASVAAAWHEQDPSRRHQNPTETLSATTPILCPFHLIANLFSFACARTLLS
jgi:hypothetical protein